MHEKDRKIHINNYLKFLTCDMNIYTTVNFNQR